MALPDAAAERYGARQGAHRMAATHEPHGHDHASVADDATPSHDEATPRSHDDHDEHGHGHEGGPFGWLNKLGLLHSHKHGALAPDLALESSAQGIRAVQISLVVLGITAALQVVVYLASEIGRASCRERV